MDIPYAVEARPGTGLFNAKVGIWLFLASEVMLFGALFSSYILLRVGADPATWPRGLLNIPIGTFNTTVLITSSITVVMSWASLKMGNFGNFRKYQAITLLCALSFLGIKSFEYRDKFSHYEIWKTDGSRLTGHLEGKPYFWNTKTLAAMNLASVTVHPDRGFRPVLALRRSGLDFPVPRALFVVAHRLKEYERLHFTRFSFPGALPAHQGLYPGVRRPLVRHLPDRDDVLLPFPKHGRDHHHCVVHCHREGFSGRGLLYAPDLRKEGDLFDPGG